MAAQFGDQRDHAGVDAIDLGRRLSTLEVPAEQPAGAAGQIEADAQPIPAVLEGCDAGIALEISRAIVAAGVSRSAQIRDPMSAFRGSRNGRFHNHS